MNITVSNTLIVGLSREANARGTTVDVLADALLRAIIEDKLFDAVIDDEQKLQRDTTPRYLHRPYQGERLSHEQRRARILATIDAAEGGAISVHALPGYAHVWAKPLSSLVNDGTIRRELRAGLGGRSYQRMYYSRAES